jgi:predicted PurR-regulated permease PerM
MTSSARLSAREQLERLLPTGSPARRAANAGVVCWAAVGVVALAWIAARVLHPLSAVLPFVVVAALTVMVLNPAVKGLIRMRVPRWAAATLTLVVAGVVVPLLALFLARMFVDQAVSLLHDARSSLHGGRLGEATRSSNPILQHGARFIDHWVSTHGPKIGELLASAALSLAHLGFVVLIGGLLGYFWLSTSPSVSAGMALLVPPGRRSGADEVAQEMSRIVSGYVRARLAVSAVVGILATLGLWAVGMPSWLVLGLIVGVSNLIPTLGAYIGGLPVVLVSLATKPPSFLLVAVGVIAMAHIVDGFVLSPILLKRTLELHPVVVLLAVLVGAEVSGLWGVLAAVPIAAMAQFALRRWLVPQITPEPAARPDAGAGAEQSG